MINGRTPDEILEENFAIAWKDYQIFLIEHNIPLPADLETARQFFRGGFMYCMAEYYSGYIN